MSNKSDKLIIFDVDETLIYATEQELDRPCNFMFDKYYVYERPFLKRFLTDLSAHFTIGLWSSADDEYVFEIVAQAKPPAISFFVVWGRSRCTLKRDVDRDTYCFEKRLSKLKKRGFRLEKILIVDDSPEKSRTNYGNAIHIKPFTGDINDKELPALYTYLLTFKTVDNVRTIEKRAWRTTEVIKHEE